MRNNITAMRKTIEALMYVLLTSLATPAFAADGKTLYAICGACHGSNGEGNTKLGAPNIASMPKWYVARQLENFSSGKRGADKADLFGTQMRAAAMAVKTDEQRQALATYIATLTNRPVSTSVGGGSVDLAKGRSHFNAICSSCHGSNARGNPTLGAPGLIGLDATYAERQLKTFREGQRD